MVLFILFNKRKRVVQEQKLKDQLSPVSEEIKDGLQVIPTSIGPSPHEEVYYQISNTDWQEMGKERTSISYAGLSRTITLAKDLRFRMVILLLYLMVKMSLKQ